MYALTAYDIGFNAYTIEFTPKDTIIAFSNIWATYFIIRYLQTQQINAKRKYFSTLVGLAIGFGVGVRVIFI